ncbi:D-arabinose 1-dehydrogenase (NAD(P)(+)) ARA2 [Apiospora phragmitis]|uniref:D-arabinose 1-dehydrogenase (NAD(P)(+)) ARA2 n=1 Tax=Apiospora phragmitis TaxID=2905665 RepID=A0ABR1W5E8_9PEZI
MGSVGPLAPDPSKQCQKPQHPPLHEVLPPLLLGTATFNYQYVSDPLNPEVLPALSIVTRTLDLGISAFDTSPYYGPSEQILGDALAHPSNAAKHPRDSYFLVTKAGRIGPAEFDYSPTWIRYSVYRSLERLRTSHLDLVYLHDAEFVTPQEVLGAVAELRRLRDEEGVLRYVGISGYPVSTLCDLAALVQTETKEPLDAVLSYGHFTIQNTTLSTSAVQRFEEAGVDVVLNASMLGMGLLTTRGADAGPMASWHPSPEGLRKAVRSLVGLAQAEGEKLEVVAIRWAMDNWAREGASKGGSSSWLPKGTRAGVSVMGVATVAELEETYRVFRSVIEGYNPDISSADRELAQAHDWSLERRDKIQALVERMWDALGSWKDYSWSSPDPGFVNTKKPEEMGVVPRDDGIMEKYSKKQQQLR